MIIIYFFSEAKMKKISICLIVLFVIVQTGCFLDPEKKNNNSMLLLALMNPGFTVQNTYYEDDGTLMMCMKAVYPSSEVYIDSLNRENQLQSLYPAFSDTLKLSSGTTSSKWSGGIGADGRWFTDDDGFMQNDARVTVSSSVFRNVVYEDFNNTIGGYHEYQLDTEGRIIKRTYFEGRGLDNSWFTPDDVKALDSDGVCILDTVWSDADHCLSVGYDTDGATVVNRYSLFRDTSAGLIYYKEFEADGTTQISAVVFDYDNYRTIFYSTDMATVTMYYTYTLGPAPLLEDVSLTFYMGEGTDGDWFTGDDDVAAYSESTYDEAGYETGIQTYTDATKTTRMNYSVITHR